MTRNNVFVGDRRVLRRYIGDRLIFDDLSNKTEVLSGTEIFTDKADEEALVHVEVDGKSYQHAGSGKNLLTNDPNYWEIGSVNGTASSGVDYANTETLRSPYIKLKKGSYTLSIPNNIGNYSVLENWFHTYDSNKNGIAASGWAPELSRRLEIPEDGYFIRVFIRPNPRIEVSTSDVGSMFNIQLEEGSIATPYEPPAPTPDYPIEIHSLNDFDVVSQKSEGGIIDGVEVGGRNLAYSENIAYKYGTLLSNSTKNIIGNGRWFIDIQPGFLPNTTYTISNKKIINEGSRGENLDVLIYNNAINTLVQTIGSFSSGNKTTFTTSSSVKDTDRLLIYVSNGVAYGYFEIQEFKLEKGNKATDWTPAPEDVPYDTLQDGLYKTNLLLDEPLRSVGDVKDRLFRDTDGLWKVERNVGERILNGSENWSAQADGSYYTIFSDKKIDVNTNLQSSHFMAVIGSYETLDIGRMRNTRSNTNVIFYFDEGVKGVGNFKLWLSSNNTEVYYELANPSIETLSQSLQDKLNNISTYANSNYVYTVLPDKSDILSEKLKPTLHATFKSKGWEDFRRKLTGGIT